MHQADDTARELVDDAALDDGVLFEVERAERARRERSARGLEPRAERGEVAHLEHAVLAGEELPDLATLDLSFISATKVLPAVVALLAENSEIILLAKPQFEAGKGQVGKGGIVRSSAVHRTVLQNLWSWAAGQSFGPQAACASPILGAKGNREFFLYFRPGVEAREMETQIETALKEAN